MDSNTLRQKFLDFFKAKKHSIIPSASLMPENDPTVLFTTAGMHPLVPYFMGEKHPEGKRLASIQKCVRTVDIDEVGNATHHTFFEMLGNWSLGDYFKKESLEWSLEFLTDKKWLGLDRNLIAVSVFEGDSNAPFDKEAHGIWKKSGIPEERIVKLSKKDNWWEPAGKTGPCGPDSEIFYWTGRPEDVPENFDDSDKRWVEIWNNVFMEFDKQADGSYKALKQKNIDTGMGLERLTAVMNGLDDNYKTDLFVNVIKRIEELSGKRYDNTNSKGSPGAVSQASAQLRFAAPSHPPFASTTLGLPLSDIKAMRIIADHIKAATFIVGDDKGIAPSNIGQGYVVRRLIRRAIRYGRQIDVKKVPWTKEIAQVVINDYKDVYSELNRNKKFILDNLDKEEVKFGKTLEKGLKEFAKLKGKEISGIAAFNLYQTYGFPIEMTIEVAGEKGLKVDREGFEREMKKHQEKSRTASAGKFKSGLADHSEATTKYHTAAHLLLAALRKVLGGHVFQKGSNITAERLRLDFSHSEKLTDEQKKEVERLVNEAIKKNLPVKCEEVTLEKAKEQNAMGIFESKYGEKVKVYTIGTNKDVFSKEICAGPHVQNTGQLGRFHIKKEESSGAGVRRIKGILE